MEFYVPVLIIAFLLPSLVVTQSDDSFAYNVLDYGAVGDGDNDDTNAFIQAWEATCTSSSSSPILSVPSDMTFLIHPVLFKGPCNSPIINVEIAGEIVAPKNPSEWRCVDDDCTKWIHFKDLYGLRLYGGGRIHARGNKWWSIHSRRKPTALEISDSDDVQLINLDFKDNPRMHVVLNNLRSVFVSKIKIDAPGHSPNTDGIHVTHSTDVTIEGCHIATGDDCISIVDGSADVNINNVFCGPGHGISIGSLGKHGANSQVENIFVSDVVFTKSTNGARIKSWQGGSGYARNITFQKIWSHDAENPIIIDQFYCDHEKCTVQDSAVEIYDIKFKQVLGTSKNKVAVTLRCSETVPCRDIVVEDIYILSGDNQGTDSNCTNVFGSIQGLQIPSISCLSQA